MYIPLEITVEELVIIETALQKHVKETTERLPVIRPLDSVIADGMERKIVILKQLIERLDNAHKAHFGL